MSKKYLRPISITVLIAFLFFPHGIYALPQGEQVVAGSATFDRSETDTLNINVATDKMIANYQSFSIAQPEAVNFLQPSSSSVALNRVVGVDPSSILGTLTATGKIFLINPHGILFGQGCRIDTAGMVASTLNISNSDFLAGRYTFYGQGGSVVNQGYISAPGGYVALLGSTVANTGVIEANLGSVALASGEAITLNLDPQGLISVVVDEATTQNLENKAAAVENTGTITADGGKVILTAKALDGVFDRAANNEGIIEARSLVNNKGEVYLLSEGENALAANTGTIDVSAAESGADGGFVEISGDRVIVDGNINASSIDATPGELLIDPWNFTIRNGGYYDGPGGLGVGELWLERQDGYNITINALNDINFELYTDNELYLKNFNWETFTLQAGKDINLHDDSIVTEGGNIIFNADKDFWYKSGCGCCYPKQWKNTADGIGSINLGSGSLISNGGNVFLKAGEHINFGSGFINSGGGDVELIADANFPYSGHATTDDGYWKYVWKCGWKCGRYRCWKSKKWVSRLVYGAPGNNNTSDGIGDIHLGTGAGITSAEGDVYLDAVNIYATAPIDSSGSGGDVTEIADNDIVRGPNGDVFTNGGNYKANAGNDYILGNGATIITRAGDIDIYAGRNVLLGCPIEENFADGFNWDYLGGTRSYTLIELGYYYYDEFGNKQEVVFATGNNANPVFNPVDFGGKEIAGFYINMIESGKWYTDPGLNPDGRDHLYVDRNGNLVFNWEDLVGLGDADFDDVILSTTPIGGTDLTLGSYLLSDNNIFLTADTGKISQESGRIYSDNLMLSANTGIIGKDASDAIDTVINNLSAVNNIGNIRISNTGDLTIKDLSGITGLNPDVTGSDGVSNGSGTVDISVHSDLTLDAPIDADNGRVFLTADGNIYDDNDADVDVTAHELNMSAGSNIGTSGVNGAIDTDIDDLSAETDTGNIYVYNKSYDEIDVNDVTTHGANKTIDIKSYGDIEVNYISAFAGSDVWLESLYSDIENWEDYCWIFSDDLHMKADDNIGFSDARILTQVDDIWAEASNGDVYITEFDGVSLQNIQALGSTIDIITGGNTNVYYMKATGSGPSDPAIINLDVNNGNLEVFGLIRALRYGNGLASINLESDGMLRLNSSNVLAKVFGSGSALVDFSTDWGNIILQGSGSNVKAKVNNKGTAKVRFDSGNNIKLYDSKVFAEVGSGNDSAIIHFIADDDIRLFDSVVKATAYNDGPALILFNAYDEIELASSLAHAKTQKWCGDAASLVNFRTERGDIVLKGSGSNVKAEVVDEGVAVVNFNAGDDVRLNHSNIKATVGNQGTALVRLNTRGEGGCGERSKADIVLKNNSNVLAQTGISPDTAIVYFNADNDIMLTRSNVKARSIFSGPSNIDFHAGNNIFLDESEVKSTSAGSFLSRIYFDAENNIGLSNSNVVANTFSRGGLSRIRFDANNIGLCNSDVKANALGASAWISFNADNNIWILNDSLARAFSKGAPCPIGGAYIDLTAADGNITVNNSKVKAIDPNGDDDHAKVTMDAGSSINITDGEVFARVVSGLLTAEVDMIAGHNIKLIDSLAEATNDDGPAYINLDAGNNIILRDSDVIARSINSNANIDLNATGNIVMVNDSLVKALAQFGSAHIDFNALGYALATIWDGDYYSGDIIIRNSEVTAKSDGEAKVKFDAQGDIKVKDSEVKAKVDANQGKAKVAMNSNDDIEVKRSTVKALVDGHNSEAKVKMSAGNNITIEDSPETVSAYVNGDHSKARVKLEAGNNIKVKNSSVAADVDGEGHAAVKLQASNNIDVRNSLVHAQSGGGLETALVTLFAGNDIDIDEVSTVSAFSSDYGICNGLAAVLAIAGNSINSYGQVLAESLNGVAGVAMLAHGDIYAGNVLATGSEGLDVIEFLEGWFDIDIGEQYDYSSGILLGSLSGDITLGNITADMVLAAALGGSIEDVGNVYAHYLGLLAQNNIGTEGNPINTTVDILSAYSWDTGDIYINEADDIELGLYLPLDCGALGASVAANDGIIHVTSDGDMIVNSVVAPRAGVFLETTDGSIYAGRGWCPAVLPEPNGEGIPEYRVWLLDEFLMDVSGTQWETLGGISDFASLMFGSPDLPPGPNVVAGGYSYFSAPNGTIGVGTPPIDDTPADPTVYNPLDVCIQVIDESHSAFPEGYSSIAGLALQIGSSTVPDYTIDTGNGNGSLGVSGEIMGIVRPGVTAVTGVYPSPDIDLTGGITPPGYIFYDDNDSTCCCPLYGPPAANLGALQIWPEPIFIDFAPYFVNALSKTFRAYYEILDHYRVVSVEPATPTTLYAYHPLTSTDSTAFDEIVLDIGAYEFIAGNIKLKKTLAPYFGEQEEEGKR